MTKFEEVQIEFKNREEARNILGDNDEFLKIIKENFSLKISGRGLILNLAGQKGEIDLVLKIFSSLTEILNKNCKITSHEIKYAIKLAKEDKIDELHTLYSDAIFVSGKGKVIRPKTIRQREFIEEIMNNHIVFSIGPAGTGKTYLAVVMAAMKLRNNEIDKIILTRPAVEAGEKLGFLPGDLNEKIDPYLRPLYDAIQDIMGSDMFNKLLAKNIIEIAPLAYMRGRTLERAFIILDEAQNTTKNQMKMFLTRLGFGSKMVINGDLSQTDLPKGNISGLSDGIKVLKDISGISVVEFTDEDVIRHDIVAKIIKAYEKRDMESKNKDL